MKVVHPTWSEIAYKQAMIMLGGNYLSIPQYYTQLFSTFKLLLDEEHIKELDMKIKEIEVWLTDDFNPLNLQEAEIRMWNNMDLNSGFQVNGVMITQQEIYSKLDEIKNWLRSLLAVYLPYIRFTVPVQM
jgi:hypothetical protein